MKKKKKQSPKNWNQILLIALLVCTIFCFILGITLFAIGIRKILPVILIFVLSLILSISIFFLARDTYLTKKAKDKKMIQKNA